MTGTQEGMREKQLNIRLNDEEAARLALVADHYGLNGAGVFRMLLKREADAIATSKPSAFAKAYSEPDADRKMRLMDHADRRGKNSKPAKK